MRLLHLTFVSLLGLLGVACGGGKDVPSLITPDRPSLHRILEETRSKYQLPGLCAQVLNSQGSLEQAATGVRKLGAPESLSVTDLFHLGSNGKALTATLAGLLVEEGRLSWDENLSQHFPEIQTHPGYQGASLRQLLSHTAGLPALESGEDFLPYLAELPEDPVEARAVFTRMILLQAPPQMPGAFAYSNAGTILAAALMERMCGQTWESLIQKKLLQPLNIRFRSAWPALEIPSSPWGHWLVNGRLQAHDPKDPDFQIPPVLTPMGGLSMTATEYTSFLRLHLAGLRGQNGLLKASSIQTLHQPVAPVYALGWGIGEFKGKSIRWHTGSTGTFFAVAILVPDLDRAILVLVNAGHSEAETGAQELALQLLER